MFNEITIDIVFAFLLLFARVGSALVMLPGIGEAMVSARARLLFAVGFVVVIFPVTRQYVPPVPVGLTLLLLLLAGEVIIGLFIGVVARMLMSTMHTAGMIMSYQIGLSAALLFDPAQGTQGSVIGNFLTILFLVLLFTSDLHHIFISGIVESYTLIEPGSRVPVGDMADFVTRTVAGAFAVAFKLAAPLVVIGLLVYLGAGVMSRLMPSMHVFFVLIPIQVMFGIFVLMVMLSAMSLWYLEYFGETMGSAFIS